MVINRKIVRTMKEHKAQYFGSILLIALSCMLFSMFNIMGKEMERVLSDFKKINVQEDASFIVQTKLQEVSALEKKFNLILEERGFADDTYAVNSILRVLSKTNGIDKYTVIQGKDMTQSKDVLLDPGFAKAHNITLNNQIQLFGTNFTVTGFISSPDYIYPLKTESDMVKNPEAFGISVISKADYQALNRGITFYSVKFNINNKNDFINYLEQNNMVIKWVNKEDNMRITFIEGDMKGIGPMGKVLPPVILLVTCVLVSVILWRLLKKEFTQVGVFYAMGYRKQELLSHYLSYALFLSLAGSILGTSAGVILIKPFITFIASFYNLPVIQIQYSLPYIIISIIIPFLFLVPTTLLVVRKALTLTPLDLLRGGANKTKVGFLEKKIKFKRLNFSAKFKIREVVRNIPRALLMLLGVTFASSLLLLGFSLKDSMDYLMNNNFEDTFHYSNDYVFNSLQTNTPKEGEKVSFSPFTYEEGKADNTVIVYGVQKDANFITLKNSAGEKLAMDQVIISRTFAQKEHVHVGDTIQLKNKITAKKITLPVDQIAQYYLGETIYLPLDMFNSLCGYPAGSYLELYTGEKADIDANSLISATNRSDTLNGYKNFVKPLQYMVDMIGIAAFLIGLIIIYVVTSLIIEENRGNISLMKILGYQKRELYQLLLNSNTIFVFLGFVLSIPMVFYSLDVFFHIMTADMSIIIPVKLNNLYIFIGFVIVIFTYELAKLLNRKKIVDINMADSLKNRME